MKKAEAWIDDIHLINVNNININTLNINQEKPYIWWKEKNKKFEAKMIQIIDDKRVKLQIYESLPMGEELILKWDNLNIPVYPGAIVRTDWFDENYANTDATLGATYVKEATTFTLWAPTAISVILLIDDKEIKLDRLKKGIWQKKVNGDLNESIYEYNVNVNGKWQRANDPYTKAMLANSEKGVVVDLSITDPPHFKQTDRPKITNLQDTIIYELHIRDATIQKESGVVNRGKYLGLTEENTTSPKGNSTGLSYIKELGVTHVEILPMNDFARVDEIDPSKDYNWGYDPLFFQVPEGSYATSAVDPTARITEAKQMIQTFHEHDLSVILDVVYNHVYIIEESAFELIVPGYYFRYHQDGTISDGTGVGNDFASERLMGRKFILDTVDFWLNEYNIDGFRFDLMGIMDIKTVQMIHDRCQQEDEPIMLLGEGWDLATALPSKEKATMNNASQLKGIRFFNDYFRDTIKGTSFDAKDHGYVNGIGRFKERLASLMTGSAVSDFGHTVFSNVNQSINFVEVHDNFTLWDQLKGSNPNDSEEVRRKMHQLATGITLLSQGVPFIHAGQEWFRTKDGDGNSYFSGDLVNQLDWNSRDREIANINFVKELITLRKKCDVFRLTSENEIRERIYILDTVHPLYGMVLLGEREDIVIYINPSDTPHKVQLPSAGIWQVLVTNSDRKADISDDFFEIEAYEFVVILKSR